MSDDGLIAALARAQKAMSHPKKTKTNPHFKSQYADLADVLNAVRPALNEQGIAIVQTVEGGDLVTELRWQDEAITSRLPLYLDVKPQELGSQLSYLRRYALSAICGVATEDDDDGNEAQTAPRGMTTGKGIPASDKQAQYLVKLRGELVPQDEAWRLFAAAVLDGEIPDIPSGPQTSKLIDALLAAKKGTWPANVIAAPSGIHIDDGTEPF